MTHRLLDSASSASGRLFVTGMARSGTTLLDRLLSNHPEVDVLSQPFPLVFVEVKRRILEHMGSAKYYVLNDDSISREYSQQAFDSELARLEMLNSDIEQLFVQMADYSGQLTRPDRLPVAGEPETLDGLHQVLENCLQHFNTKPAVYVGMKEIMCEEFLPYLGRRGYKCIVIIRDPRDVLSSANYPRNMKYFGEKKPTLFVLRTWRKSVEFARQLSKQSFFHFLRYEDLVTEPYRELERLTNFLELAPYDPGCLEGGIRDRAGEIWLANTSRKTQGSFISQDSLGSYRTKLSAAEVAYTEAVCAYEMDWLGYVKDTHTDLADKISSFKDYGVNDQPDLPSDFSQQTEHVAQELSRLDDFKDFYSWS